MKTSNKILTTFLSIIAIYFLVFALDLRLLGVHRNDRIEPQYKTHTIPISKFKYLKLENIKDLKITPVLIDSSCIEVTYISDSTFEMYLPESRLIEFNPTYSGDTMKEFLPIIPVLVLVFSIWIALR